MDFICKPGIDIIQLEAFMVRVRHLRLDSTGLEDAVEMIVEIEEKEGSGNFPARLDSSWFCFDLRPISLHRPRTCPFNFVYCNGTSA